jgi:hypothetical protein
MRRTIRQLLLSLSLLCLAAAPGMAGEAAPGPIPGGASSAELPLTEVVLYTSGVGYFQRDGMVDGRAQAELSFRAEQINDLLKSLVARDLDGGQVGVVTYDSRDPVTKTLKSFAVDLTDNLSQAQLLGRLRGEAVEVAAPGPTRGTILGVETRKETSDGKTVREVGVLTLLAADGIRSIPLEQIQRIQVLDPRLDRELALALETLAAGRDTQKKGVRLDFSGQGRRRVRIGYIAEAPVWKSSYRLAVTEADKPFLQGWAIVENTTDEDWKDVRLSLVSGRPVSFTMNLYEPVYIKRPSVALELQQGLRPELHEQAIPQPAEASVARSAKAREALGAMAPAPAAPALRAPSAVRLDEGVVPAAQGRESGELFQFTVTTPVSLARHKSAMLPLLGQEIQGSKLALFNERVHGKHPMNGIRLKNSTPLQLLQGPITVFDGGIYAGDARLGDLGPGQDRLITYALDLKTEVEVARQPEQELVVSGSLKKGLFEVSRKYVQERSYTVVNRDAKRRVVVVEHPTRDDWRLAEPATPSERTRDAYRFELPVEPGASRALRVREERQARETVSLANLDVISFYLQAKEIDPRIKDALRKVVSYRQRLGQVEGERVQRERQIEEISKEQGRIRENMGRLAQSSELYARYVKKLGEQETDIERLRSEVKSLRETEQRQQRELEAYLLSLDLS